MKFVIFYEKQGCVTNARQKQSLRNAGCIVFERNLLKHGMSVEELLSFFEDKPIEQCFNPNAPQIKSGEINPSLISRKAAMQLFLKDPILIKRPLLYINNQRLCGFNQEHVEKLLDINLQTRVSTKCSEQYEKCVQNIPLLRISS